MQILKLLTKYRINFIHEQFISDIRTKLHAS